MKRSLIGIFIVIFILIQLLNCNCSNKAPQRTILQDSTLNKLDLEVGQTLDFGSTKITKIGVNSYEILEQKPVSKTKIKIKNVKINSDNKEVIKDKSKVKDKSVIKEKSKENTGNKTKEFLGGPAIALVILFTGLVAFWFLKKKIW